MMGVTDPKKPGTGRIIDYAQQYYIPTRSELCQEIRLLASEVKKLNEEIQSLRGNDALKLLEKSEQEYRERARVAEEELYHEKKHWEAVESNYKFTKANLDEVSREICQATRLVRFPWEKVWHEERSVPGGTIENIPHEICLAIRREDVK